MELLNRFDFQLKKINRSRDSLPIQRTAPSRGSQWKRVQFPSLCRDCRLGSRLGSSEIRRKMPPLKKHHKNGDFMGIIMGFNMIL